MQNKPQIVLVESHKNHSPCILTILALNVKGPTFIKIKGDDPNDMQIYDLLNDKRRKWLVTNIEMLGWQIW